MLRKRHDNRRNLGKRWREQRLSGAISHENETSFVKSISEYGGSILHETVLLAPVDTLLDVYLVAGHWAQVRLCKSVTRCRTIPFVTQPLQVSDPSPMENLGQQPNLKLNKLKKFSNSSHYLIHTHQPRLNFYVHHPLQKTRSITHPRSLASIILTIHQTTKVESKCP